MTTPPARRLAADIALCLVFFTRLPLPRFEVEHSTFARAIWAAPVVGLVIALVGGIVFALAVMALSAGSAAALALAAMMLATGCLHEDGLSDTADGFGGGRTQEKKLEIMRDSRIGTYGACALVFSILLRWSAISELGSPIAVFCGLMAAHAASRALLPAFMQMLPPARADGLSAGVGAISSDTALSAAALGALALLALGLSGAIAAALCLGIVFFLFRSLCLSQIGGQTGDATGALQQAGEITVLLVASAIVI